MLHTELTHMFGLRAPVIGAPMAGVAGGELAAAVSRAGGIGMIGASGATTTEWLLEQGRGVAVQGLPYGVGLMAWTLDRRADLLEAVLELRPALVSVSFGDVAPAVARLRDAGVRVASQVNSVDDARAAMAAGADLLVAQGTEAGGHTGRLGTLPVLQAVLEVADRPVVAAGGIGSPAGLAAVLAAGAAGAWVGTALVASPEGMNPPEARERVVAAAAEDTVLTPVFDVAQGIPWPDRWHGRALVNDFTERWHGRVDELRADASAGDELRAARERRDYRVAYVYAGQAAGLVHAQRSAEDVVRELAEGAESLLRARIGALLGESAHAPGE